MKTVLTIAGSDSIGGAGIQADIKTISANGCYAMSVITSVTAQNTMCVTGTHDIPADFVRKQLEAVFDDIVPDAIKIGMLSDKNIITTVAEFLIEKKAENVVVDTIMVSTSGYRLIAEEAVSALTEYMIPVADIITPNIPEAEILSGTKIKYENDMKTAAEKIMTMGCKNVIIKGGHLPGSADDVLYDGKEFKIFRNEKIDNPNTHGTGCTLSSAIASNLALGFDMTKSVENAKKYITGAIADGMDIGKGNGSLNHFYQFKFHNA